MVQSPSAVILEPPEIKSFTVFIVSPSICHEVMWLDAMILVFWMQALSQIFTLLFHFHQEALLLFFTFCHNGGVICISEVIDISPSNLDFSLCFIQPGISHDRSKISRITICGLAVLLFQFGTSLLLYVWFCFFLTCIQISQEAGKVD